MLRSQWKCLVCLAALALFVGCGTSTGPKTVPVTGTVTLDGTPVAGAVVTFSPEAADGRAATGTTDGSGRFELTTTVSGDGAVPGSYFVGISKTSGGEAAVGAGAVDEEAAYKAAEEKGIDVTGAAGAKEKPEAVKDELPPRYKSPGTSGFDAEVKEGEKNDFTFPMTTGEKSTTEESSGEE